MLRSGQLKSISIDHFLFMKKLKKYPICEVLKWGYKKYQTEIPIKKSAVSK